jgi:peroxiredoxin
MVLNREGQRVPQLTFRISAKTSWYDLSTASIFERKTVLHSYEH